jgi:hypothetical protein
MMQPLFVDTGGWIAYFDKFDNAHVIFMGADEDGFVHTWGLPVHIADTVDPGGEPGLGHPLQQPVTCFPILRGE